MKILKHPLLMRPTPESELEQVIDRELRALPVRRAPAELLPRVLRAIAERERRPWWQKAFAFWPWPARFVFLIGTSSLAAMVLYFTWGLSVGATLGGLADEAGEVMARLEFAQRLAHTIGGAISALVRASGAWVGWALAGLAGACYLTTLALGTVWYRLVSQRI